MKFQVRGLIARVGWGSQANFQASVPSRVHVVRLRPQHQLYELTVPRLALRLGRRWSGADLTPREEQHLAGLDLGRVAEQRGEGSCDRGGKSAVLWEGLS